ncbi:MAG: DUF1566 domain-containing protein [Bacteroidota bacterium]
MNDLSLGSFSLTNPGGNIYLARYNPGTGEYLWINNLLSGVGNTIADIATDSSGNILLMGKPNGGLSTVGGLPITNSVGGYVVKIDPDGNTQWLYEITSGSVGSVNALATDASGRISFCGRYINTIDLGGATLSSPTEDIFLATLNANGTLDNVQGNFVTTLGSFSPDALALDIDAQGNRYLGGYVNGTYTFGSTVLSAPTGQAHPFVAKFDATGNVQWAQAFPSTNIGLIKRIAVAPNGNVYAAGGYQTSLTIGGTTLTPTNGTEGSFVSLLDPSGTVLWTRGVGPIHILDRIFMDVGQRGEVYLASSFNATLQVGGQTLTPSSPNREDAVVLQFQPDGTLGWVQQSGGSQDEFGEEVLYASGDKVYVGGYFSSNPATFGRATLAHTGPFFSGYIWPIDALTGGNATLDGLSSSQDNDRDASNELQNLSLNNGNLSISAGNTVTLPDADPTNEIELPTGGNLGDVLQFDSTGNYSWVDPSSGVAVADTALPVPIRYHGDYLFVHPVDNAANVDWATANTTCQTLTAFGFSDWFLPSRLELDAMYKQSYLITGLSQTTFFKYWSRTEQNADYAFTQRLDYGGPDPDRKTDIDGHNCRCVRRN